jgi:hypothetical protein
VNKKVVLSVLSATFVASVASSAFAAPNPGLYIGGNVDKYYAIDTLLHLTAEGKTKLVQDLTGVSHSDLVYVDHDGKGASIKEILDKKWDNAKQEPLVAEDFEESYGVVKTDGTVDGTYDARKDVDPGTPGELTVEKVEAIDLRTIQVTFGTAMDEATATDPDNYQINGAAFNATPTISLSEDGKTVTIDLDAADQLTNKDYYTLTVSLGNTILDAAGNALDEVDQVVYVNDTTKPTVTAQSYVKANDELTIDFSEEIDTLGTVTFKDADGVPVTVPQSPAFVSGDKSVTFDTSGLTDGETYTMTMIGAKDLAGNYFANNKVEFTFKVGSEDVTKPTIQSAVALSPTLIQVTFSEKLSAVGTINSNPITVVSSEADRDADYEATVDSTGKVYTIQVPAMTNDTFTAYAFAGQVDLAGNTIDPVSKNVAWEDSVAPAITSTSVTGKVVTINFSEAVVDATGAGTVLTPSNVELAVADGDIDTVAGNPKQIKVDLSATVTTVENGTYTITIPEGVITDAEGNSDEYVVRVSLPNTDTDKPEVAAPINYVAAANGGTVEVTFDEPMGASALDLNKYTVDGVKVFKKAVFNNVNKTSVLLTLSENVFDVDAERTFAVEGITDAAGNLLVPYTEAVTFEDNTAPTLVKAELESDLQTITLTFSEDIDPATLSGDSGEADFTVYVGDVAESGVVEAADAGGDAKVYTLTLSDALTPTEFAKAITIKPTTDFDVADVDGNLQATFTSKTVTKE